MLNARRVFTALQVQAVFWWGRICPSLYHYYWPTEEMRLSDHHTRLY